MQQHSERVMRCLDEFGRTYPGTIGAAGAAVRSPPDHGVEKVKNSLWTTVLGSISGRPHYQ